MNCIEFQAVLDEYVDGGLPAADAARGEQHLAGCAACRAQAEALSRLLSATAALPREMRPERNLWPEIKAELEAAEVARTREDDAAKTIVHRGTGVPRSILSWLLPLGVAAAIVGIATLQPVMISPQGGDGWTVASIAGTPRVERQTVSGEAQLRVGQWVETDADSRAKLASETVGHVSVEPNSRLRLAAAKATNQRLELQRGTMSAFIWAPPRLFLVDTPAARAVDLGCAYTMTVDDNGDGELHVTLGYVALEHGDRESLIPARTKCLTRRNVGPGTPFDEDAPEALRAALKQFDFEPGAAAAALPIILQNSRPDDAVTLWHLLARTSGDERGRVFDALAHWHKPPAGVTRAGILSGNTAMRKAWGTALGIGVF